MASFKKHYADAARRLGESAARRMALLSSTIPYDQVVEECDRESRSLDVAVTLAARELVLQRGFVRSHFEAAVSKALNEETDRILSLIARGSPSPQ